MIGNGVCVFICTKYAFCICIMCMLCNQGGSIRSSPFVTLKHKSCQHHIC